MWKVYASVALVFILGFTAGAIYGYGAHHCSLNKKQCIKTRARLRMWAKRYKRKLEELNDNKRPS